MWVGIVLVCGLASANPNIIQGCGTGHLMHPYKTKAECMSDLEGLNAYVMNMAYSTGEQGAYIADSKCLQMSIGG